MNMVIHPHISLRDSQATLNQGFHKHTTNKCLVTVLSLSHTVCGRLGVSQNERIPTSANTVEN